MKQSSLNIASKFSFVAGITRFLDCVVGINKTKHNLVSPKKKKKNQRFGFLGKIFREDISL